MIPMQCFPLFENEHGSDNADHCHGNDYDHEYDHGHDHDNDHEYDHGHDHSHGHDNDNDNDNDNGNDHAFLTLPMAKSIRVFSGPGVAPISTRIHKTKKPLHFSHAARKAIIGAESEDTVSICGRNRSCGWNSHTT